jgi:hypothetical protein
MNMVLLPGFVYDVACSALGAHYAAPISPLHRRRGERILYHQQLDDADAGAALTATSA